MKLMVEVLDHAPTDWSTSERLIALVIAEQANDGTRVGYPGMDLIVHRLGVDDEKSASRILRKLSAKGYELRVPLAEKAGKPVFAVRSRQSVYRIPPLCPAGEHNTTSCLKRPTAPEENSKGGQLATQSSKERVAVRPPNDGEKGGPQVPMGGHMATPSPQSPQKPSPQTNGSAAAASAKRDWTRVDDNNRREDAEIQKLAEPLRTVALSLADTDPDASIDEARAVHRLVAQQAMDAGNPIKGVKYYTTIAERGGFSVHLANVRARRLTDEKDAVESAKLAVKEAVARLRETEPDCVHGTAAGAALHPTNGQALCPQCRRGIAAVPEQSSRASDKTSGVVSAYQATWVAAGHGPIEMTTLGAISTEARQMFAGGYPLDQLLAYAKTAAAARQTLAYAARKFQEAPL